MKTLLRRLLSKNSVNVPTRRSPFRPALEGLEDRTVPTVTFHGGAVLSHVKVQAVFVGSQWANDPALYAQARSLNGVLNSVVNSSYMDALTNAGYGAGRGSVAPGRIDASPQYYLNLSDTLTSDIANRTLQFPDGNTLYVCFEAPNVSVRWDDGSTSASFGGDHYAFHLQIPGVITPSRTVRFAVIAYPGGTVGNAAVPSLSTLDSVTKMTSQEIADAVTDPDAGFARRGWYDDSQVAHDLNGAEIGDLAGDRVAYVNGYAMQRVVNKHDFVMTPAQAAPNRAVNFVLQPDGNLVEVSAGGSTTLSGAMAALSDQGIDNQGRAVVDVVTSDGLAFEVHDDGGTGTWVYLGSGVKSARAGQGVSYVLFNNGNVYEHDDATGVSHFVCGSATQIDAGTDVQGVNAVDAVVQTTLTVKAMAARVVAGGGNVRFVPTAADEYSDDSGAHFIAAGVQSVSAGRQGVSAYVTTGGEAYWYGLSANIHWDLGSGVAQVTAGTDLNGNYMLDLLLSNGTLREYRPASGWYTVAGAVKNVSKGRLGAVDMVLSTPLVVKSMKVVGSGGVSTVFGAPPSAWEHTLSGWRLLSDNATAAV